jgi:ABC-type lipoprotein release transport system permease subunit
VLLEGLVIGTVGGGLALMLGHVIGAISVSFIDQFTLFDYRFALPRWSSVAIASLALATCATAAVYPALVAPEISSAESLHYE